MFFCLYTDLKSQNTPIVWKILPICIKINKWWNNHISRFCNRILFYKFRGFFPRITSWTVPVSTLEFVLITAGPVPRLNLSSSLPFTRATAIYWFLEEHISFLQSIKYRVSHKTWQKPDDWSVVFDYLKGVTGYVR